MKQKKIKTHIATFFLFINLFLIFSCSKNSSLYQAEAIIAGKEGSGVSGFASLTQNNEGVVPTVLVSIEVSGLEPGSIHGCHIHEKAACEPNFGAAGGHLDPGPYGMSNPDANHPFHMGDLPNLVADDQGVAKIQYRTSRITLSEGPLSIFDEDGSAIIVHVDPDLGTTGQKGGAGGARLACGIIEKR
tara:strand:- start:18913 stop:19476 length:564 start_codon:yes stop_codon:yes gene_type:complete